MLKLTKYGEKIQEDFLEQCKKDGTYQRVFEDFEDGTRLLESSVRSDGDYAAWCLLTYGEDALNTVYEWRDMECQYFVFTNNYCSVGFWELVRELRQCFAKCWDDGDSDIGVYDFYINGKEMCIIRDIKVYCHNLSEEEKKRRFKDGLYEFGACLDGCAWHDVMQARTLAEAKAEAEAWFIDYYQRGITSAESRIEFCKEILESLR